MLDRISALNGIITNGLLGDVNNLLIAPFHLGFELEVTVTPVHAGSAGEAPERAYVHFRIKYHDREVKKTFEVGKGSANFIFKSFSGIKHASDTISVVVKRITHELTPD